VKTLHLPRLAGLEFDTADAAEPGDWPEIADPNPHAQRLYLGARRAADDELLNATPSVPNELGFIPLPCAFEGVR